MESEKIRKIILEKRHYIFQDKSYCLILQSACNVKSESSDCTVIRANENGMDKQGILFNYNTHRVANHFILNNDFIESLGKVICSYSSGEYRFYKNIYLPFLLRSACLKNL